jgi:anaerobic selenocysteine-containing dehydrogenase
MTNHWGDIANSDVIMCIGSNPAENHPAAFGHMQKAIDRGATLISIDPRFTRTSSRAHIYTKMRSGTDIAFVGGIIKYVLDDIEANGWGNYNEEYVKYYTNALFEIASSFEGPADTENGLFSGYAGSQNETDNSLRKYTTDATGRTPASWRYATDPADNRPARVDDFGDTPVAGITVWEILKKHFARYDRATVLKITGADGDAFDAICSTYASTGKEGKSGTIMYAMGTTQHTNGTQMIRSYVILQLLLGNIGICGGGINALRGESNVQGSTDMCLLAHILPGYLKAPLRVNTTLGLDTSQSNGIVKGQDASQGTAEEKDSYLWMWTPVNEDPDEDARSLNYWKNTPRYMVSLLKAFYGANATADNEFCYQYLPKVTSWSDHYHISLFEQMYAGTTPSGKTIEGLMCWGQNPAVGGPNAVMERKALEKLGWLVAVDLWETETAAFWKRPGVNSSNIQTEVFLLPAASSYEKEGSVTNSGRWMQWRYKALNPPGEAKNDLWIMNQIMTRVKELYDTGGGKLTEAIAAVDWDYGDDPDPKAIAKEINGYNWVNNQPGGLAKNFTVLKFDGTTSCGNWLYCDCYVEEDDLQDFEKAHLNQMFPGPDYTGNRATRRWPVDVGNGGYDAMQGYKEVGLHSYWAWCWPLNRRIIYNKASVDLDGNPWDTNRPAIAWVNGAWVGDVPDASGKPINLGGYYPFIMQADGRGHLFDSSGRALKDGPLPEHYEPWESPVDNLMSGQQNDPAFKLWDSEHNERGDASQYPIVCTTYRLVEHWQAGQMTRNLPWLVEMQPEVFVEMSEELAAEKGISNGGKAIIENARGSMEAVALVTKRFQPFQINGQTVHQVGIPWHWGYIGLSTGDSANVLTPHVGDANTMIPEYKAFLCNVRKA